MAVKVTKKKVTKKVVKNSGKNMENVVKILPNQVKDMSLAPLGRHKIDLPHLFRDLQPKVSQCHRRED